jgi:hypothetical protein
VVIRSLTALVTATAMAACGASGFDSFTSAMPGMMSGSGMTSGMSESAKSQAMQDMQSMLDMMGVMRDVYQSRYGNHAGYPPVPGMPSAWPSAPGPQAAPTWNNPQTGYNQPPGGQYGAQPAYPGGGTQNPPGGGQYQQAPGTQQWSGSYGAPAPTTGSGSMSSLLDGVWEGSSGEILEIRGNQFRIYADEQRQGQGLLSVKGDMLVWEIPSSGMRFEHQFLLSGERLMLRDASTGETMLFQRRR